MMQSLILLMACIGSGGLNGYSQELENTDRSDTAAGGEPQIKIDEKRKISYSQEIQPLLEGTACAATVGSNRKRTFDWIG